MGSDAPQQQHSQAILGTLHRQQNLSFAKEVWQGGSAIVWKEVHSQATVIRLGLPSHL